MARSDMGPSSLSVRLMSVKLSYVRSSTAAWSLCEGFSPSVAFAAAPFFRCLNPPRLSMPSCSAATTLGVSLPLVSVCGPLLALVLLGFAGREKVLGRSRPMVASKKGRRCRGQG